MITLNVQQNNRKLKKITRMSYIFFCSTDFKYFSIDNNDRLVNIYLALQVHQQQDGKDSSSSLSLLLTVVHKNLRKTRHIKHNSDKL